MLYVKVNMPNIRVFYEYSIVNSSHLGVSSMSTMRLYIAVCCI